MANKRIWKLYIAMACILIFSNVAFATEYTSTSYKVLDPVFNESSEVSTSASYQLIGTLGELAPIYSTSTSYTLNSGSGAYPVATAPVLSATAGALQVSLSWTASTGSLGWTVSGYDVCTGTTTNTYTCEDAGNVTSFTKSSLISGTLYFFRVRAKDAFSNVVVRSNEGTATPVAASSGGSSVLPPSSPPSVVVHDVTMSGYAYPGASVSLLSDGSTVGGATVANSGTFSGLIPSISTGIHTFGIFATDSQGVPSVLVTYTVNVSGIGVSISNIVVPPTSRIAVTTVTQGDSLVARGMAYPASTVTARSSNNVDYTATATSAGQWTVGIDTASIDVGNYTLRSKVAFSGFESDFGPAQLYTIASAPVVIPDTPACQGSDINKDVRINLADVSILLSFWKGGVPSNICADINSDNEVNLIDFSILLFNWTG